MKNRKVFYVRKSLKEAKKNFFSDCFKKISIYVYITVKKINSSRQYKKKLNL